MMWSSSARASPARPRRSCSPAVACVWRCWSGTPTLRHTKSSARTTSRPAQRRRLSGLGWPRRWPRPVPSPTRSSCGPDGDGSAPQPDGAVAFPCTGIASGARSWTPCSITWLRARQGSTSNSVTGSSTCCRRMALSVAWCPTPLTGKCRSGALGWWWVPTGGPRRWPTSRGFPPERSPTDASCISPTFRTFRSARVP
jgi:hypothetical protein